MRFNLTVAAPDGMHHWRAFQEVMDSMGWALSKLGHEVSTTSNWLSESKETNVLFGCELLAPFQKLPRNTVVVNLEQQSHPHFAMVKQLAKGLPIWDFSARNVEMWQKQGYQAHHLPIGFTPNLNRIPHCLKDIDVCFFGWDTPRRRELLDALRQTNMKVFSSTCCYGGARDEILSRSKVVLNVHHDGRTSFEIVRCSYLMANAKCIITEVSDDDADYTYLDAGLVRADYRGLVAAVCAYTTDSARKERNHLESRAMEIIYGCDFTGTVTKALDATTFSDSQPSSRIAFHQERAERRKTYFEQARNLKSPDPRVLVRYERATKEGDMKDFVLYLRSIAKGNVVEIGVRDGASTSAFLLGLEEKYGHLWSVDIQPCGNLFKDHPLWTFVQADSKDFQAVIKRIPFEIDVLLIDGDHSEAGVKNDIEYARQLRPGGLVLFHDIAPEEKPSGCTDMSWPGDAAKNVYVSLCLSMGQQGWKHWVVPGRYGLGVLQKPEPVPVPEVAG